MMSTSRNCCLIARISERAINSMSKDALLHLSQLAPVPKKMEIEVLPAAYERFGDNLLIS